MHFATVEKKMFACTMFTTISNRIEVIQIYDKLGKKGSFFYNNRGNRIY